MIRRKETYHIEQSKRALVTCVHKVAEHEIVQNTREGLKSILDIRVCVIQDNISVVNVQLPPFIIFMLQQLRSGKIPEFQRPVSSVMQFCDDRLIYHREPD